MPVNWPVWRLMATLATLKPPPLNLSRFVGEIRRADDQASRGPLPGGLRDEIANEWTRGDRDAIRT